jgi:hypothetical protein
MGEEVRGKGLILDRDRVDKGQRTYILKMTSSSSSLVLASTFSVSLITGSK